MKKWTTTKLITAGSLGVLSLILQLPGASIPAITGLPMTGFINAFVAAVIMMVCLLIINQRMLRNE